MFKLVGVDNFIRINTFEVTCIPCALNDVKNLILSFQKNNKRKKKLISFHTKYTIHLLED